MYENIYYQSKVLLLNFMSQISLKLTTWNPLLFISIPPTIKIPHLKGNIEHVKSGMIDFTLIITNVSPKPTVIHDVCHLSPN